MDDTIPCSSARLGATRHATSLLKTRQTNAAPPSLADSPPIQHPVVLGSVPGVLLACTGKMVVAR